MLSVFHPFTSVSIRSLSLSLHLHSPNAPAHGVKLCWPFRYHPPCGRRPSNSFLTSGTSSPPGTLIQSHALTADITFRLVGQGVQVLEESLEFCEGYKEQPEHTSVQQQLRARSAKAVSLSTCVRGSQFFTRARRVVEFGTP